MRGGMYWDTVRDMLWSLPGTVPCNTMHGPMHGIRGQAPSKDPVDGSWPRRILVQEYTWDVYFSQTVAVI